jgi:Mor family transcriptional regulator
VPPRRLLVGQEDDVVRAYEAGATVIELATRFECSRNTIAELLRDRGVALRARGPRSPLEGREPEVVRAYEDGSTVRELVDRFGANQRTVRKVLADAGVVMRRTGRRR